MRKALLVIWITTLTLSCVDSSTGRWDFTLNPDLNKPFKIFPSKTGFEVEFLANDEALTSCKFIVLDTLLFTPIVEYPAKGTLTGYLVDNPNPQDVTILANSPPAPLPYYIKFYECALTKDLGTFTANYYEYAYPTLDSVVRINRKVSVFRGW